MTIRTLCLTDLTKMPFRENVDKCEEYFDPCHSKWMLGFIEWFAVMSVSNQEANGPGMRRGGVHFSF